MPGQRKHTQERRAFEREMQRRARGGSPRQRTPQEVRALVEAAVEQWQRKPRRWRRAE